MPGVQRRHRGQPFIASRGRAVLTVVERATFDVEIHGHADTGLAADLDRVGTDGCLRRDRGTDREVALAVGDGGPELDPGDPGDKLDADGVVGRDVVAPDDDDPARIDPIRFDEDAGDAVVSGRRFGQAHRDQPEHDGRKQPAPRGHQPRGAGPIVGPGYPGGGRQGDGTNVGQFGAATGSASWQVMRPSPPPRTVGAIGEFAVT